ncbi:MAG: hypothetical protein COY66_06660 [Candidatus Kerfeldbacteria bacterium CG_4_10_14_0_8_um_filter_42_10]|uniref:Rod shape-determining protein MreD n=1 Tax=Candidatus Kerfeldbacteria bacterium CG_4_10_14_0_8_um_filter_42_10 TaxID=2014248 RepID=A0A2M7RFJ1_9BACT|nr:MAG: hypothetical protein COY66_06660 [Candidatus Kerfeldbacteria bacterium CG_4_10_14_0_8_um_filter_42_10]
MLRNSALLLTILILDIIQASFINLAGENVAYLNILIIFLVFLVFYLETVPMLWFAFLTGAITELFSFYPFGIVTAIVVTSAIFLSFLFKNFLTNRSLYTFLLLTAAGTIIYNLLIFISSYILYWFEDAGISIVSGNKFWIGLLWQLIINVIVALVLFLIARIITRRFSIIKTK